MHLNFSTLITRILDKINAKFVAPQYAQEMKEQSKKTLNKTHFLSKEEADELRAEQQAKEASALDKNAAQRQKKPQQALKVAEEVSAKPQRAEERAVAKNARETNAEMARIAKINLWLLT